MKITCTQITFSLFFLGQSCADISYCNPNEVSVVCKLNPDYNKGNPSEPIPLPINITLNLKGITDIDVEKKTIGLDFKFVLEWPDERISINQTEADLKR